MIRLIVALIGLLLLLLWVAAPFAKRTKIILTALAFIAITTLVAMEIYNNKPRNGLVTESQIVLCGLDVKHSYRSDYKASLCLENQSTATVKRITFQINASRCATSTSQNNTAACELLESRSQDRLISIAPNSQGKLDVNARFNTISEQDQSITWSAEVLEIKAVP